MACRSAGMPGPGGYWLCPARIAATAASSTSAGPSVSGKPWPRLIEPVRSASADISVKMVVPKPASRSAGTGSAGDELEVRAAPPVALRDVGEDLEHRGGGGRAVAARERRGVDPAHGRLAPQRADDDVVADGGERELGDQRDADPGGDEALDRGVIVGLEG